MAYIGPEPNPGQNREVDDISSGFNGGTASFTLQVNGQNVSPGSANAIIVSLGGVVQNPGTDYTVAASTITFTTAPASGLSFFGLVLGQQIDTEGTADGSITLAKFINGTASNDGKYLRANNGAAPTFSSIPPTLTSVTGQIVAGASTTLTLAGSTFLSSGLIVNFVQSSDSINANVTVTPTSDSAATVTVPSAVHGSVTAGNVVTIKVTNSDGAVSPTQNVTAVGLPTGGSITTSGSFRIHTFTSSGTFGLTFDTAVEYLVIAGGGGAGTRRHAGAGGAGGYRTNVSGQTSGGGGSAEAALNLTAANYTVTIGAGGTTPAGGSNTNAGATVGGDTTFGSITSAGGGRGGTYDSGGTDGGSGGGGGAANNSSTFGGNATASQGSNGGRGGVNTGGGGGGGGGGASAAGGNASGSDGSQQGGNGGDGLSSNITGSAVTRGGGGGGGGDSSGTRGLGGSGGGGLGATASQNPTSGGANTGGGSGAGGPDNRNAFAGGSGIVIVRYTV